MQITLPEQVEITLAPAHFGSRALAYITDFSLRWGIVLLFVIIIVIERTFIDSAVIQSIISLVPSTIREFFSLRSVLLTSFVLFAFIMEWGYPIFFEVRYHGVTPGKRLLGLRVVNEHGLSITWRASLLRTILLIVDILPGVGFVGLVSMFATKRNRRIGDLVARTMVIYDTTSESTRLDTLQVGSSPTCAISLNHYKLIEQFLVRKSEFSPQTRISMASKIQGELLHEIPSHVQLLLSSQSTPEQWISALYDCVVPTRESEAGGKHYSLSLWRQVGRESQECEAAFAKLADSPRGLSSRELFNIALVYQQVCQRYGYLSTLYPGAAITSRMLAQLHRGRRLIYSNRLQSSPLHHGSISERLSGIARAMRGHILLSFFIGAGMGTIGAIFVVINPNLVWSILSEDTIAALREGKLWTEALQGNSLLGAARIMTNNIGVTLAATATGVTGGVGTALLIAFNGLQLGTIFASLSSFAMAMKLFDFVVAHGILELSVILVAGGCGFYIADGIINPGVLTRTRSLQRRAEELIELVVFNGISLVAAGTVEGFVSPYTSIPFFIKLALGLTLGAVYWSILLGIWSKKSRSA